MDKREKGKGGTPDARGYNCRIAAQTFTITCMHTSAAVPLYSCTFMGFGVWMLLCR